MHAGTACKLRRSKHEKQQAIYSDCLPDCSAVSSSCTIIMALLAYSMQITEGGGLECSRGMSRGMSGGFFKPLNADPSTFDV